MALDQLVGVKDVAKMLGISRFTVAVMVRRREIPHFRLGRRIVLDPSEIRVWLKSKRIDARPGPLQE